MANKTDSADSVEDNHIQVLNEILIIAAAACDANTYFGHCFAMGAIVGKCEAHLDQMQQSEHPRYSVVEGVNNE